MNKEKITLLSIFQKYWNSPFSIIIQIFLAVSFSAALVTAFVLSFLPENNPKNFEKIIEQVENERRQNISDLNEVENFIIKKIEKDINIFNKIAGEYTRDINKYIIAFQYSIFSTNKIDFIYKKDIYYNDKTKEPKTIYYKVSTFYNTTTPKTAKNKYGIGILSFDLFKMNEELIYTRKPE